MRTISIYVSMIIFIALVVSCSISFDPQNGITRVTVSNPESLNNGCLLRYNVYFGDNKAESDTTYYWAGIYTQTFDGWELKQSIAPLCANISETKCEYLS